MPALRRQGLVIVATLATAYVASHFFRASNVTIGLDLMRDLAIGPEALGALTGAFFFGFSAMQIPCGFLFDRFGPRRTVTGMLLLAVLGATVFTLAPSWPILLAGRALMGAGFGVMLIGSMVVISRWFPPDRFSTMAGDGAVDRPARQPSRHDAARLGHRADRLARRVRHRGGLHRAGAIAVWLVVRDAPPDHPFLQRKVETPGEMLRGMGEVLRNPQLPFILTLNFCNYACTFTVQGLWGGPFLREVHGLTIIQSGNVLLAAVIAYQVGMLTFGPLDRLLDTRKWIAIGGTVAIAADPRRCWRWRAARPLWVAVAAIVAIGFFSASSTMVMTHGRGIFPDRLIGRGMSTMNTCVMLGVACMQTLSGPSSAPSRRWPTARARTWPIGPCSASCAGVLVAVAIYSRVRDVRPSDELRAAMKATADQVARPRPSA